MPDVSGIPAIDVGIGLAFLFFMLSIVCSSINEGIAVIFRLRARTLTHGVISLLDDPDAAKRFYDHWRIKALTKPGSRRPKPSYIPSRAFALTLLERSLAAGEAAVSHRDLLTRAQEAVKTGKVNEVDIPEPILGILQDAVSEGKNDFERLVRSVERNFDQTMDRASGWYKRRAQLFLFVISVVVVIAINADSFTIGQRLWNDKALRAALVTQANAAVSQKDPTSCAKAGETATSDATLTPVEVAQECLDRVDDLHLPVGWKDGLPETARGYLSKGAGLLITAFALTLGAPFWFDLLGKVAQLRGSGPAPPGRVEKTTDARKRRHKLDVDADIHEDDDNDDEPDDEPGDAVK